MFHKENGKELRFRRSQWYTFTGIPELIILQGDKREEKNRTVIEWNF